MLWWGGMAIQNSNKCTSGLLQNSVSIATSTLFTMVTPTLPTMDSSRAWLTTIADNNDEGDIDYNDDDKDGLRADWWPEKVTQRLTHRHVRRSSTRVNVIADKEWKCNVSKKSAELKCDVSIFTDLKLVFFSFLCGCFSLFLFYYSFVEFAVVYNWLSWGGRWV